MSSFFSITGRGQQCAELVVDSLVMWLPLRDDRIAAPVRTLMGKAVQRTASSASDRGSCQAFFFQLHGEGNNVAELVDDVMVTLSAGRGEQCCELVDDIVTFSVGTL